MREPVHRCKPPGFIQRLLRSIRQGDTWRCWCLNEWLLTDAGWVVRV